MRMLAIFLSLWISGVVGATVPSGAQMTDWRQIQEFLKDDTVPGSWRSATGLSPVYYHLLYGSEDRALFYLDKIEPAEGFEQGAVRLPDIAVSVGSQRVVSRLLALGDSPNATRQGEFSPLMTAAKEGHLQIMRMLLAAGADPNYAVQGITAAHYALQADKELSFRLVIDSGMDLSRHLPGDHERAKSKRAERHAHSIFACEMFGAGLT